MFSRSYPIDGWLIAKYLFCNECELKKIENNLVDNLKMSETTADQDTKVYFGNLSFSLTSEALSAFASTAGKVLVFVFIMKNLWDSLNSPKMDSMSSEIVKYGKRSKGFGFVTYATKEEAAKAIETLDTKELDGRPVTVKLSRPKTEKPAVRVRKFP